MEAAYRSSRAAPLKFTLLALFWLGLVAFCYHKTNCTFLRAESGWLQAAAHSDSAGQKSFERNFFLHSYHGHYIPLAFLAEFKMTRLFGMHVTLWKARAIAVIALLAILLSNLVYRIAKADHGPDLPAAALAFGLTSLIVFHPLLREFVAFPILIFQAGWMVLFVITLRILIEAVERPHQKRWIWMAVIAAYGSMHCYGLGAITAAATAAVMGLIVIGTRLGKLPQFAKLSRTWLSGLLVLLLLSGLHLAAMKILQEPVIDAAQSHPLHFTSLFSLAACILIRASETVVCPWNAGNLWVGLFESRAPFGVLLAIAAITGWAALLRSYLQNPTSRSLMRCLLHTFTMAGFTAILLLVAGRVTSEPAERWFEEYLNGPHHLVPELMILFPSIIALTLPWARGRRDWRAILIGLFGVAILTSNKSYPYAVYRPIYEARLSHQRTWAAIAAMARECRAANLPVPDLPARTLGEFPWSLHFYEPLLQYSLQLPPSERIQFVPWHSLDKEARARYVAVAPSLNEVRQLLQIPKD